MLGWGLCTKMFTIYIDSLDEGCKYIFMFADDARVDRYVAGEEDAGNLIGN